MGARVSLTTSFCAVVALSSTCSIAQPCSGVCADGSPAGDPNRSIDLQEPYSSVNTCGDLERLAPLILRADSEECGLIQSLGAFCGCAVSEGACQLCPNSTQLADEDQVVDFEPLRTNITTATCGLAQAYLQSTESTSATCASGKADLEDSCLCSETNPTEEKDDSIFGEEPDESESATCSLCESTAGTLFSDKDISYILGDDLFAGMLRSIEINPEQEALLNNIIISGQSVSCGTVNELLSSFLPRADDTCGDIQKILGPICGCSSMAERSCGFCGGSPSDHLPVPHPDTIVNSVRRFGFPGAKCEDIRLFATHEEIGSTLCGGVRSFQHLCGCNNGERNYLGSTTTEQRIWLSWMPRISGLLSIIGSVYVLVDVWRSYRNGNLVVFQQLIGSIAFCDILSSIGWLMGTAAIPKVNEFGESEGIYGAIGNEHTCTLQGFLIQFGVTAVIYHISLTSYYLLVVKQGWREHRVQKIIIFLHLPFLLGLGMALAGIYFYDVTPIGCYILSPPLSENLKLITIFGLVPFSVAALIATLNMTLVYCSVRKQAKIGNRWRFQAQKVKHKQELAKTRKKPKRGPSMRRVGGATLAKQVFFQNVFYLGSFYLSWTVLSSSQLVDGGGSYGYWLFVNFLAPLQGFTNFLIFIRPRVVMRYNEWRLKKDAKTRLKSEADSTDGQPSRCSLLWAMLDSFKTKFNLRPTSLSKGDLPRFSQRPNDKTSTTVSGNEDVCDHAHNGAEEGRIEQETDIEHDNEDEDSVEYYTAW